MYHNGWRGDSSEADSSPLVPHLYHQPSSDPATYPPADPNYTHYNHHQMHNHPQMQFVHPNQNQFSHPHLLHNPPPYSNITQHRNQILLLLWLNWPQGKGNFSKPYNLSQFEWILPLDQQHPRLINWRMA